MMKGESFEYAIKKDVRNNPIVREVDNERHREMWRSLLIGAFVVVALVFFAWHRFELLWAGYDLGEVDAQITAQETRNEELQLELQTLSSLDLIEERARRELHMGEPGPDDHTTIQLVMPSASPGKTVMAQR